MKKNLLFMALLGASILTAQNTITTADPVDGTEDIVVPTSPPPTYSGLDLGCNTTESDLFYLHTPSTGDNKINIGLTTVGDVNFPSSGITVNYQIIRAVGGSTSNLEEIVCSSYQVTNAGGSFTYTSDSAESDADTFYLRVYVPAGISNADLFRLVSGTDITMTSEFDTTLSSTDFSISGFSYRVRTNSIELSNVQNFKSVYVFDISGKQIMNVANDQTDRSIDISNLRNGVYIMNLVGSEADNKSVKFVKK